MRTHLDVDENLLRETVKLGGFKNRTEAVNSALDAFVKQMYRRELLAMRGRVRWQGDLGELRRNRFES